MYKADTILFLIEESMWSKDVKSKWHSPPGLFKSDDANKIAKVLHAASKTYKQAVSRVNFYYNRAGDNIPAEKKETLVNSILDKLRSLFGVEAETEKSAKAA